MNEFMIHDRIEALRKLLEKNDKEHLRADNEKMQDFLIWLKGFLDGNISKRGEGKE